MIRKFTIFTTAAALFGLLSVTAVPAQERDEFEKADETTEQAIEKAGRATGAGVGEAVEQTARGATKAGKATAGAVEDAGEAVVDFFDGEDPEVMTRAEMVRAAQRELRDEGYYSGPIDGVSGPKTRASLREFQIDKDLPVTGTLNMETRDKLF